MWGLHEATAETSLSPLLGLLFLYFCFFFPLTFPVCFFPLFLSLPSNLETTILYFGGFHSKQDKMYQGFKGIWGEGGD